MSQKPWGPQGDGEWVKIPKGGAMDIGFPAWVQTPGGCTRFVTRVGSKVNLQWSDGDGQDVGFDYLTGDYVWVPAPAVQPEPEPKPDLPEKTLLQVAQEIINGPKADDYGPAHINLGRLAVRWSQVVGVPVSIEQVGLMMADLKICRLIHSPNHYDSWVDLAGYPGVVDKAWRGE